MSNAALATAQRYTWDDATDLFESALQYALEKSRPRQLLTVGNTDEHR
jgi:hypothetical protein